EYSMREKLGSSMTTPQSSPSQQAALAQSVAVKSAGMHESGKRKQLVSGARAQVMTSAQPWSAAIQPTGSLVASWAGVPVIRTQPLASQLSGLTELHPVPSQ